MMTATDGNLLTLTGGVQLKKRVQHPKVHERQDRGTFYWYFRYRADEILADGSIKTSRRFHTIAPSKGEGAIGKRRAEEQRDIFLAKLNAADTQCEAAIAANRPVEVSAIIFGKLAQLWRTDYVDNQKIKLAEPTRKVSLTAGKSHLAPVEGCPDWPDALQGDSRLVAQRLHVVAHDDRSEEYHERNLHARTGVGNHPRDVRKSNGRVKLGRKWGVRPDRILDHDETEEVFDRLADPHLLISETCIDTGTRISEAVGLQLRHFNPAAGTITILQRHCRGDVDEPKTKNSKGVLVLGSLLERYNEWIAKKGIVNPTDWILAQDEDRTKPMWDSGVRKALKIAAQAAGCDFEGFGLHSFRRANITWRQEVGGSAIEASKIAGHATVSMTGDYTIVQLQRQGELTRAIQKRRAEARAQRQACTEVKLTTCESAA